MILSRQSILARVERADLIIRPFFREKVVRSGKTFGLGGAGYDIRVKLDAEQVAIPRGGFLLATTVEYMALPNDLEGEVKDKSSWARLGLAVQNTTIEPGWRGYLTLQAYGTYLNWLDATGQLSDDEEPEQRFTPARVDAYRTYLAETLAPASIRSQLTDLARALSVVAPGANVAFLRRRAYCYPKTGDRLAKRQRMQEPEVLLQLGLDLMAAAESKTAKTRRTAVLYRDGLLISVLACRAMRLRNLTSVEIGRHLTEKDEKWSLLFDCTETRNAIAQADATNVTNRTDR
jgi:hypothetical protein